MLLDPGFWPQVRAAIDLSLDCGTLSDDTIALPIFWNMGEFQVLARDPLAATRTGDDLTHVQNAAVYLIAALLVGSLPQVTQEKFDTDYQYTKQAIDRTALAATLRARADDELDAVLDPLGQTSERPTQFALGRACRGRW